MNGNRTLTISEIELNRPSDPGFAAHNLGDYPLAAADSLCGNSRPAHPVVQRLSSWLRLDQPAILRRISSALRSRWLRWQTPGRSWASLAPAVARNAPGSTRQRPAMARLFVGFPPSFAEAFSPAGNSSFPSAHPAQRVCPATGGDESFFPGGQAPARGDSEQIKSKPEWSAYERSTPKPGGGIIRRRFRRRCRAAAT